MSVTRSPRTAVAVVGIVAGNRQHVAAEVRRGDPVLCVPEPENPHDRNAVAVFTMPASRLTEPGELISSVADPPCGRVGDRDRAALLARHVGYLPRAVAATLTLPPGGVVGWVSAVRYPPPEYDAYGRPVDDSDPVGFDVTARLR